jgi:DNA-binding XRE family transcriptional regulator
MASAENRDGVSARNGAPLLPPWADINGSVTLAVQDYSEILTGFRDRVRLRSELPEPEIAEALRKRRGITRAELAEAVGVSAQSIYFWERSLRKPQGENRGRYVEALRILEAGGT